MTYKIPPEIQRVVVFDTNAYRDLCSNKTLEACKSKTRELINTENANKTEALANLYTIMELASHLADTTDPHYDHCLNALVSLGVHTQINNGIKMIADSEATICKELFGKTPENHKNLHDVISSLTSYIRDDAPNISDLQAQSQLKAIHALVEGTEKAWIDGMKATIAIFDIDGAKKWELGKGDMQSQKKLRQLFTTDKFLDAYASAIVTIHANKVGVQLTNDDLLEKAKQLVNGFKPSIKLLITVWSKIATKGGYTLQHHKEKRSNYVWDFWIACVVGKDHFIGNAKVYLVTGDKRIKEAADETGCGGCVMDLNSYLTSIGITF
jgi:hypothetical protein